MRLLADENIAGAVVSAVRAAGFDTTWIRQDAPGSTDEVVLARAVQENRVLLTFDRDFGELVVKRAASRVRGVILFRITGRALKLGNTVAQTLASRSDWEGHFSVVEPGRIRMRPLGQPSTTKGSVTDEVRRQSGGEPLPIRRTEKAIDDNED